MAHAAIQLLASGCGAEVLHIKGAAADPSLRVANIGGMDADVLVRPEDVGRLVESLVRAGWTPLTTFETDSDFGCAASLRHPLWGVADVHRSFPGFGVEPGLAFDRLWRDRVERDLAGVACPVPSIAAQAVILVLNAARSRGAGAADVDTAWHAASIEQRQEMSALISELSAEVAFAAGTGTLDRYRGTRQYDLWRIESEGGTRMARWAARIKAAPTAREAIRLALRAPMVNTDHLALMLGRSPTRLEILQEFLARPVRGVAEMSREQARRSRRRGHA